MAVSRRAVLKGFAAAGVGAVAGAGSYGYLSERHELELTRANVPVVGLPPALSGLRIGLITDVHRSRWVSADDVSHAVSTLMREQPDLIVLGGDYVTWGSRQYVEPAADALRPLSAPHGVFGILGNHDDDHDMPAALARTGVQMLKDAHTRLMISGEALDLSGHTHGGQVVLPIVGAIAARKFSPPVPLMAGIGRRGDTTIFVSRGVGTIYVPVRINCPPEVAVLTLQREAS
jgi:uncharacterized protein